MFTQLETKWDGHLGLTKAVQHQVELAKTGIRPVHSTLDRTGTKAREFENKEMNQMLAINVFKPAQTELASPIVSSQKKSGNLHFCFDYCKLNKVKTRDLYSIPRIDEWINSLRDATIF